MEKKLGLTALTALVLSSMLGAGVFSLPQNMAEVASPAALLIGWSITGNFTGQPAISPNLNQSVDFWKAFFKLIREISSVRDSIIVERTTCW